MLVCYLYAFTIVGILQLVGYADSHDKLFKHFIVLVVDNQTLVPGDVVIQLALCPYHSFVRPETFEVCLSNVGDYPDIGCCY